MKKSDNTNFRTVVREGEGEVFVCNICDWEAPEAKRVKLHISKKHRERSLDSDEEDEETKKLRKADGNVGDYVWEQFDGTGMVTSTQVR